MPKYRAVLHLPPNKPLNTIALGMHVVAGFREFATLFPNPPQPVDELETSITTLRTMTEVKEDTTLTKQQIMVQNAVVVGFLTEYLHYTNMVSKGDKTMILSSGFDCNNDWSPVSTVPDRVVIRRVIDGKKPNTMKVFVEPAANGKFYKLQIADTLDAKEWTDLNDHCNLYGIEAEGLEWGKPIYVRVVAGNSNGWGVPSDPVVFIPR